MAEQYLDKAGLTYLWGKIKNYVTGLIAQSDWNETDSTSPAYIANKPTIPPSATVDDALSDSSANPVQNQVIKAALDGKAASSHNHGAGNITSGILAVARGGTGAATAAANKVFAGPSSGDAAAPSFRGLAAADIPGLAASKITSGTLAIARGGTGAATTSANRVFAGPSSGDAAAPSFRALAAADIPGLAASKITSGTLAIARGGTGKTYGYTWQSLGSCTGTGNKTYDLTNYSEVMVIAKFASKIMTVVIPKAALTTSNQELWVGGGKSANDASAASGAVRAVCNITTTKLTGVASNNGATDTTSSTTWYIYAR